MAYAERAYYQYTNPYTGVVDRLEIHEDGYTGGVTMLKGASPHGIDFEHRETTSEQREYLSIFENQIMMGVLTLKVWVTSTAIQTMFTDISDAPTKKFRVEWKRDSDTVWYGFPSGRILNYPEQDPEKDPYIITIQFKDFAFLKGEDFPLSDTRRTLQTSLRTFFSKFNVSLASLYPLRTITSWQAENTDTTDDFLNQVWHDTYALRDYASDGYSQDQTITYYEALERTAEPMLIIYQWKGFNVFQISALKNPSSVLLSTYGLVGQLTSASSDVRQTIYTDSNVGLPSAKINTGNSSYPAIRKVLYEYNHRSGSTRFEFETTGEFPPIVNFDGSNHYVSTKNFTGNGDEKINFLASYLTGNASLFGTFAINVGKYALDSDYEFRTADVHTGYASNGTSSINTTNGRLNLFADNYTIGDPVMLYTSGTFPTGFAEDKLYYIVNKNDTDDWIQISESAGGSVVVPSDSGTGSLYVRVVKIEEDTDVYLTGYRSTISFLSGDIPSISESEMQVVLIKTGISTDGEKWNEPNIFIENPTSAGSSTEYRLNQDQLYPDTFNMGEAYYGDGPFSFSKSSYRYSITLGNITTGWKRRGEASYVTYAQLRLREVLDYQRFRQLKKNFKLSGEFDPISVSVYEGDNYMYVGGSYNGRWHPTMVKIEENLDV